MKHCRLLVSFMICLSLAGCGVKVVPEGTSLPGAADHTVIKTDPDEKVVLNIADWSDSTRVQREKLNREFEQAHPNVRINYTTMTQAQFNETVVSGIRSHQAPDLFPLPSNTSLQTAVREGWYLPLDLYLDPSFFEQFVPEAYQEAVTMVDGSCYLLPESREIPSVMMFVNLDILRQCGISLDTEPLDREAFTKICRTVTEQGNGNFYGIVTSGAQTNRIDLELRALCGLDGVRLGPPDQVVLKDGQTQFAEPGVIETLDWYGSLASEGLFHPDSAGITAPEARKLFEQGKAAFIIQGSWCIPAWNADAPDLMYDVTFLPVPEGQEQARFQAPFTKGWMGISADSEHPDIAAEYLEWLYSREYQERLMAPGGFVSIRRDLGLDAIENTKMKSYVEKADLQSVRLPDPVSEYPQMQQIYNLMQPVVPDFGNIGSSLLAGNRTWKQDLAVYDKKLMTALGKAVDAASSYTGISLEDFDEQE